MSLLVRTLQAPADLTQGERALRDYIKIIQDQKEQRERKDSPPDLLALARKQRENGKGYGENG